MTDVEPLWTSRHVADYLRVSLSWVEHAAAAGTIPSSKIGRMRRFVPSQIRALAAPTDKPAPVVRRGRRKKTTTGSGE